MYFKASCRNNPQTQKVESYYRLVESYRDANNYTRHKTIVTAGFIDHFFADELIFIQKNITDRINGKPVLLVQDSDAHLLDYADESYCKALKGGKVDSKIDSERDMAHVDLNTFKHLNTKDKLYQSALDFDTVKDDLEKFLSKKPMNYSIFKTLFTSTT